MTVLLLTVAILNAQTPAPESITPAPESSTPAPAEGTADASVRAAQAAERAATAAERAAAAAERIATRIEGATAPAPVEPAAAKPADKPKAEWAGSVGVSLISLTGNSESLTASGIVTAERKSDNWISAGKLAFAYGQSRAVAGAEPQVVALNALAQFRVDRRFTPTVSTYALVGVDSDHLKSIEYRALFEGGAAITWVDRQGDGYQAFLFRTDFALRYAQESRHQYYPVPADLEDVQLVAPKLGVAFRYGLSKDVSFTEDAEVLLNLLGPVRTLVSSTSKLNARLIENLSLGVGFQITYDSLPAAGKVATDTALTVGVEMAF